MKIDYKSLFLGFCLGGVSLFSIFFIFGNIQTDFSISTGQYLNDFDKNIEVKIEQTIINGEDITNVILKGKGDVTKDDLEDELEKILQKQGIDREKTKMNITMEIET